MASEQEALRRKNEDLAQAYKDKSRKLLQTQELYDKAKRKAEMGLIQRAASDVVDSNLCNVHPLQHEATSPVDHIERHPGLHMPRTASRIDTTSMKSGVQRTSINPGVDGPRWAGSGLSTRGT